MRIIARSTLQGFVESLAGTHDQPSVKAALDVWFAIAKRADWKNSAQVKLSFATASIVSADRVVFNIKGNAYRLVAAMDYGRGIVWVKWIGSHRAYDRIDVKEIEYER